MRESHPESRPSASQAAYHIRVGQHLDAHCAAWLAGLEITNLAGGEALLSGYLADQSALYGVLQYLRDMNIPLIDISRGERNTSVC